MAQNQIRPRSPISWVGGKSKLTQTIIPLIPAHHCYVEVFAGAAWVLFRKPPSKVEVINDINGELVNMYKVIRHHHEAFIRAFDHVLVSRDQFREFMDTPVAVLTDIQRAVRFFYTLRTSYAAKVVGQTFTSGSERASRLNFDTLSQDIEEAHNRLKRVWVENRPFEVLIPQMDKPNTFFYIDPPYWDCEDVYGKGLFGKDDFVVLRDLCAAMKGKFIMSINDVPQIRELFADFCIREVKTQYSVNRNKVSDVTELLIANFELDLKTD